LSLAAHQGGTAKALRHLTDEWTSLTVDQVYSVQLGSLVTAAFRWIARRVGPQRDRAVVRGLLDMRPLLSFLESRISLDGIARNIAQGNLSAVALSATRYGSGETITFVQDDGTAPLWSRAYRSAIRTAVTFEHVLASAAIPIAFPAVQLGDSWYGDGSVRQGAPLAPAVHLGARAVLAIGMRPEWSSASQRLAVKEYPSAAQAMGLMVNSVFLDALDSDAERLERVNLLLSRSRGPVGQLRPVELLMLRPSLDLGALARPHWRRLPPLLRGLVETIGGQRAGATDFLSYLLFDPAYTVPLMEMGYDDAMDQRGAIEQFLATVDQA